MFPNGSVSRCFHCFLCKSVFIIPVGERVFSRILSKHRILIKTLKNTKITVFDDFHPFSKKWHFLPDAMGDGVRNGHFSMEQSRVKTVKTVINPLGLEPHFVKIDGFSWILVFFSGFNGVSKRCVSTRLHLNFSIWLAHGWKVLFYENDHFFWPIFVIFTTFRWFSWKTPLFALFLDLGCWERVLKTGNFMNFGEFRCF